jgi:transposase-like protein
MPRRYPSEARRQVIELASSGTRVSQLVATFGMTQGIYNWLAQERTDRGEDAVFRADQALELEAATEERSEPSLRQVPYLGIGD